jgi:hypothetical protein
MDLEQIHLGTSSFTAEGWSGSFYPAGLKSGDRGTPIYGYANKHFAGLAPATIRQFGEIWKAKGLPNIDRAESNRDKMLFEQ